MFFLAIVPDENIRRGIIIPGYILCISKGKSEKRTGWRVSDVMNGEKCKHPKLLVRNPFEHPEMIDFLRCYRTRSHMHRGKYIHEVTKKYYPHGGLFWFECDKYGTPTGMSIFVMKVPSKSKGRYADMGMQFLTKYLNHESNPIERLGTDYYSENMELSNVKIQTIYKTSDKNKEIKNGSRIGK